MYVINALLITDIYYSERSIAELFCEFSTKPTETYILFVNMYTTCYKSQLTNFYPTGNFGKRSTHYPTFFIVMSSLHVVSEFFLYIYILVQLYIPQTNSF